jgi:hypothetical protein
MGNELSSNAARDISNGNARGEGESNMVNGLVFENNKSEYPLMLHIAVLQRTTQP